MIWRSARRGGALQLLLHLLALTAAWYPPGDLAIDLGDNSGCRSPGQACSHPIGGVCVTAGSKISCDCPSDKTMTTHNSGEKFCQTKLLDVVCHRDSDAACQLVKDSVCTVHEARCVCLPYFAYVPHRHQCKPIYTKKSPTRPYCKACQDEGGVCVKEDDLSESNGELITENGHTFRLSCACPAGSGVPRLGPEGKWAAQVCSTRLRDIDELCDDATLVCRSKNAVCRRPRDVETDIKKCQCPDKFVPVYQPWLKYYECFERVYKSEECAGCGADSFGICYSASNGSQPGCLCPRRMSTPAASIQGDRLVKGSYCSKRHVTVACQPSRMTVTFDPNYANPPYNELAERLGNNASVAFVEGSPGALAGGRACRLVRTPDGLYTASLDADADTVCGRRTVEVIRSQEDTQVLKATLAVLWSKDFYSYPDIIVELMCRLSAPGINTKQLAADSTTEARKPELGAPNFQPPAGVSSVRVSLHALSAEGRSLRETQEGEFIRLDILLDDPAGGYTHMLVQQCTVSSELTSAAGVDSQQTELPRQPQTAGASASAGGSQVVKLIDCGGAAHSDSGLSGVSFHSTRAGDSGHQQTGGFPAFRLANLPSLYFTCSVRLCKDVDSKFCLKKTACKDAKMAKRSPNDGIKLVDSWVHIVVTATANRRTERFTCEYSMCLSTGQVVVIILILLVMLALVSGLIVVVYRRRLLIAAHRLRLETNNDDDTPTQTPVDALCKGALMQHHRFQHHQQYHPYHQQQQAASGQCSLPRRASPGTYRAAAAAAAGGEVATAAAAVDGAMRAYATLPIMDRRLPKEAKSGRQSDQLLHQQQQQQHHRLCQAAAALLDNRPDVCTCDRSIHSSYSITSSQV